MKKVILIAAAFVMLFCSVASATSFDNPFETMNDQEIMLCYQLTMEQMNKRGLSPYSSARGVTVPQGRYTVGVDIPAGTYRLEFPDDEFDTGMIYIYPDADTEYPAKWYSVGKYSHVQILGKLELSEGMIFDLQDTTATFYIYTGLLQLVAVFDLVEAPHQADEQALREFAFVHVRPARQVRQFQAGLAAAVQRVGQLDLVLDAGVVVEELGLEIIHRAVGARDDDRVHGQTLQAQVLGIQEFIDDPGADRQTVGANHVQGLHLSPLVTQAHFLFQMFGDTEKLKHSVYIAHSGAFRFFIYK